MAPTRGYEEISDASISRAGKSGKGTEKHFSAHGHHGHHKSNFAQFFNVLIVIAAVFAVTFNGGGLKLPKTGHKTAGLVRMTASLDSKPIHPGAKAGGVGPPMPRVIKPLKASVQETVEFKLPRNAKAGQILHVLVPGQHDLQPVRVPPGAKAGMMLSVKVSKTELEGEEGEESAAEPPEGEETIVEEVEEDAEIVEEDAEIVEEDVVFTWTHFCLLIFFVGIGTMVMFYFVKGVVVGFGPLEVDGSKIIDHPCRFPEVDKVTERLAEDEMNRRREIGSDAGTPQSTPRAGMTPRDDMVEDGPLGKGSLKKGSTVREMGRSTQFTKKSPRTGIAVETLQEADQDLFASSRDHIDKAQGGAAVASETNDRALVDKSYAASDLSNEEDEAMEFTSNKVFVEVWERGKWLVMLMIFQSLASIVLAQFEDLIKAHVVIALFLTMLIGSGGNAGGQSVAKAIHEIAVRGRTTGSLELILRAAKKQLAVAIWLGLILGWTAWVRVWIFHGGYENSMAISISCAIIVFVSILLGSVLPYGMLAAGLDEIHSGAVIQVVMDIFGVSITCIVCWTIWG